MTTLTRLQTRASIRSSVRFENYSRANHWTRAHTKNALGWGLVVLTVYGSAFVALLQVTGRL